MKYLHELLPNLDHRFGFGVPESAASRNQDQIQFTNANEQPMILRDSDLATAFERGRQDAISTLHIQHEAQLEEMRTAQELNLEETVKNLEVAKASEFSSLLKTTFVELEQKMDSLLFSIVNPFIKKLIPATALKELEALAKAALSENVTYRLDVRGPEVLLSGIKENLSSLKIEVVTEATDSFDVQVRCDEFLLTTRMQEWLKEIDEKIDK